MRRSPSLPSPPSFLPFACDPTVLLVGARAKSKRERGALCRPLPRCTTLVPANASFPPLFLRLVPAVAVRFELLSNSISSALLDPGRGLPGGDVDNDDAETVHPKDCAPAALRRHLLPALLGGEPGPANSVMAPLPYPSFRPSLPASRRSKCSEEKPARLVRRSVDRSEGVMSYEKPVLDQVLGTARGSPERGPRQQTPLRCPGYCPPLPTCRRAPRGAGTRWTAPENACLKRPRVRVP